MSQSAANEGAAPRCVGIVGAGLSGVDTARVLAEQGLDVLLVEQCDDVGGGWSGSRAYPGILTQE